MKNLFILFSFVIVAFVQARLKAQDSTQVYEMILKDLTTVKNIQAENISVFGLKLGMTVSEAVAEIKRNKDLSWYIDSHHTTRDYRIYVNDNSVYGGGDNIMYLIWTEGRDKLNRITVYDKITPRLVGEMKNLFTRAPLEANSPLVNNLFGIEDNKTVTLDIPSIELKHISHNFLDRGFVFIESIFGSELSYFFILERP